MDKIVGAAPNPQIQYFADIVALISSFLVNRQQDPGVCEHQASFYFAQNKVLKYGH
jgi:hypothetical protein